MYTYLDRAFDEPFSAPPSIENEYHAQVRDGRLVQVATDMVGGG